MFIGRVLTVSNEIGGVIMEYIINPSWFYWIEVANAVKTCSFIAAVILLCSSIILAVLSHDDDDFNEHENAKKKRKVMTVCLVALAIFSVVGIFIPSKQTLIEMMIARTATYDNVSWTIEQVKEAVDYIISALKDIK